MVDVAQVRNWLAIENPSSGLVVAVSSSGGQLQLEVGGGDHDNEGQDASATDAVGGGDSGKTSKLNIVLTELQKA